MQTTTEHADETAPRGASDGCRYALDPSVRATRRKVLGGLAGAATALWGARGLWRLHEGFHRAAVVIARAAHYDARLVPVLREGLAELGFGPQSVAGKCVLLKPNLVEPSNDAPHVNTHPQFVRAVIELFRSWDAREILVAEGQGHCRDTDYVLEQSGLEPVLRDARATFVDLNHDDVFAARNAGRLARLDPLWLPQTLRRADLVVSLPKMKTHHWAGVTLSMKNLFGVMPGVCYGWPKNVLHYAGIGPSIFDINATVKPGLAIIDGIIGMEGDGPIMGTAKRMNVVVMGANLPAVDATAARLMGFDPWRIEYLHAASATLGPICERHIEQRGELLGATASRFELPDHAHFRQFRDDLAPSASRATL
jgi:uncharacterized protein (DUF362 family)